MEQNGWNIPKRGKITKSKETFSNLIQQLEEVQKDYRRGKNGKFQSRI
jgi:hypothetical protein